MPPYLPPELIERSLSLLPTNSQSSINTLLACRLVSHSFRDIATSESVWTPHLTRWSTSSPNSPSAQALGAFTYYVRRAKLDLQVMGNLQELVYAPKSRIPIVEKAAALSLDVYDFLRELAEECARERCTDWIALRYWALDIIGVILREKAVRAWKRLADGVDWEDPNVLLEAMASYTSDPLSYQMAPITRFLDTVFADRLEESLRGVTFAPGNLVETGLHVINLLRSLYFLPIPAKELFTDDALGKLPDNDLRPAASKDFNWPPLLAAAIVCAAIARLPPRFAMRAHAFYVPEFPGAVVGLARATTKCDEGKWVYTILQEPFSIQSKVAMVNYLQQGLGIPLSAIKKGLRRALPAPLVKEHVGDIIRYLKDYIPSEWQAGEVRYRALQAHFLFDPADKREPGNISPVGGMLYDRVENKGRQYDVILLEQVYLPRHKDIDIKKLAKSTCIRIRAKDAKVGTVKWRSQAPGKVEFGVGHIFSYGEEEGALAVIGWDWVGAIRGGPPRLTYRVVNKLSETGNLSAEVVAAAISPVSDDDFEALLGAEHLGRYFRDENGARFFANGELKGQYPED